SPCTVFDTGTGVTFVTPNTLQAAVVIDVTDAGGADSVHVSMGELCAFHIHFNLLC
uniref:Predicted gene 10197 n=1 Tax=Cricetulus griseus TaxID=10029 RepID=A0A8C2LZA5_CRIGR